jgi:ATP-dependent Lon protease
MNTASQFEDIKLLEEKLKNAKLPADLIEKAGAMIDRLVRLATSQGYSQEYDGVARYLDWVVSIPWDKKSQDIVSLENAKKVLDANHYGLENIKERILEYISVLNLRSKEAENKSKAPAILLLGLVGTGKTTMAYSIAHCLGREFGRIPMGGMGDALQLRGRSRAYPDAEPGQIMKVLRRVGTKNPVILLDEIDRITEETCCFVQGLKLLPKLP